MTTNLDGRAARVAVLIPVYRDADGRLAATLRSLNGQGVPLHAVVVDDGSPEPVTVDASAYDFPVTLLRLASNAGIERALNAGLAWIAAAGIPLVARLDNGDLCTPARLATQCAFLDANPAIALVGSNAEWRADDGRRAFTVAMPAAPDAVARALQHTVCLIHPTVTFRTALVAAVGDYSTAYPAAEDYELFRRIVDAGFLVANVPETLVVTRLDPGGISITRRRRQLRSTLRIQLRHFRAAEPLAWAGIAKTLARMAIPYAAIVALKGLRTRLRATGGAAMLPEGQAA